MASGNRMQHLGCLIFAALVSLVAPRAMATETASLHVQPLRELGVQIKLAVDRADNGHPPTAAEVSNFDRALARLRGASTTSAIPLQRKYQTIALLFGKLKYDIAHASRFAAHAQNQSRAHVDIETIRKSHGDSCKAAFGLSEALPVQLALAAAGHPGSNAWFQFEPPVSGHYRFKTDSSGPDPAIEVFRGDCGAAAVSVAANDDSFGLDASASAQAPDRSPMLVHLANSGSAGSVVLSVNDASGTISGTITDADTGQPLQSARVGVYDGDGSYIGNSGYTDQFGNYDVSVPPGTYYVGASADHHVLKLYPDIECAYNAYIYNLQGCPLSMATAVAVANAATVVNIDIALGSGKSISGTVRDNDNQPVPNAYLTLYDSTGDTFTNVYSDDFGRYVFTTLPADDYKIGATANGFGSQLYNHVVCSGPLQSQCDTSLAEAIRVSNANVANVNFNLPVLATIQGIVTGPNFQPSGYFNNQVVVLDEFGSLVAQTAVASDGHYKAGPLAAGTYYVYVDAEEYFSQIFNGIDCPQDCISGLTSATPLVIAQTGQVGVADFHLTPLPQVHGHIQDAASGLPIANVTVKASVAPPSHFNQASATTTDANGNYTLTGTPAGKYYLWAQSDEYIDQVYSGIACEEISSNYNYPICDVTGAQLLTISPGQVPSTYDFSLHASSAISGNAMTRAESGSDLPAQVDVSVYNGAGIVVAGSQTDALGNFVVSDLAPGAYYVVAAGNYNGSFMTQLWQMIDCPSYCAPTTGTPVVVGQATTTTGIDFLLTRHDAIVGRITDASGSPLSGVLIDLFDAPSHQYRSTVASNSQGYYAAVSYTDSSYFIATESDGNYVDQVYSGISCPLGSAFFGLCPLTNATPVGLSDTNTQPRIVNFVLQRPDAIFSNGFE